MYGQVPGVKPDLFRHLFQATSLHDPPWYFESPILELLDGTLEEINARLWVQMLLLAAHEAHHCDLGERPVLDPTTGLVACHCMPDRSCEQNLMDNQFEKSMLALLIVVAVIWVGYKLVDLVWYRKP